MGKKFWKFGKGYSGVGADSSRFYAKTKTEAQKLAGTKTKSKKSSTKTTGTPKKSKQANKMANNNNSSRKNGKKRPSVAGAGSVVVLLLPATEVVLKENLSKEQKVKVIRKQYTGYDTDNRKMDWKQLLYTYAPPLVPLGVRKAYKLVLGKHEVADMTQGMPFRM